MKRKWKWNGCKMNQKFNLNEMKMKWKIKMKMKMQLKETYKRTRRSKCYENEEMKMGWDKNYKKQKGNENEILKEVT